MSRSIKDITEKLDNLLLYYSYLGFYNSFEVPKRKERRR